MAGAVKSGVSYSAIVAGGYTGVTQANYDALVAYFAATPKAQIQMLADSTNPLYNSATGPALHDVVMFADLYNVDVTNPAALLQAGLDVATLNKAFPGNDEANQKLADAVANLADYQLRKSSLMNPALARQTPLQSAEYTGQYDSLKYLADNNYSAVAQANLTALNYNPSWVAAISAMKGADPTKYLYANPSQASVDTIKIAYGTDVGKAAQVWLDTANDGVSVLDSVVKSSKSVMTKVPPTSKVVTSKVVINDRNTPALTTTAISGPSRLADMQVVQVQAANLGLLKAPSTNVGIRSSQPGVAFGSPIIGNAARQAEITNPKLFWDSLSHDDQLRLAQAVLGDPNHSNAFSAVVERYNSSLEGLPKVAGIGGAVIIPFIPVIGMPIMLANESLTIGGRLASGQKVGGVQWAEEAATAALVALQVLSLIHI